VFPGGVQDEQQAMVNDGRTVLQKGGENIVRPRCRVFVHAFDGTTDVGDEERSVEGGGNVLDPRVNGFVDESVE
jgi:hypothetical protein